MGKPYAMCKVKPRLVYGALSLEEATKVMDYYVSNFDSDKFSEAGIIESFKVRMEAITDGDEYYEEPTGTYSVQFRGRTYDGLLYSDCKIWQSTMTQLEALHELIAKELGIR